MAEEIEKLMNNEEAIKVIGQKAFEKFDKDKSGELDVNELEAIMKESSAALKIPAPSKADVEKALKMIDKDKSGKIDLNEFCKFIKFMLGLALEIEKAKKK
jgi:Ca2+-binding EF-hand superfamily protein